MNTINNIAGISVATSANNNNQNNNIETLKGMIISGHDGAKDRGNTEYGREWCFNYGEYRIFINRCYGVWQMYIYKNYKGRFESDGYKVSYDADLTPNWGGYRFGARRWSKSLVDDIVSAIESVIADYENKMEDKQTEDMQNIVASYQTEFDGYMEDLKMVAESYDHIETKIEAFAAKRIVEKMAQLGRDLLKALGEYSGCEMVEDDGYWLDTTDFDIWTDCSVEIYDFAHIEEFEGLAETLDYMITESDMPLGLDDEDLEWINDGGCYCFDGYPMYVWEYMRDFISTYYHYNYCA